MRLNDITSSVNIRSSLMSTPVALAICLNSTPGCHVCRRYQGSRCHPVPLPLDWSWLVLYICNALCWTKINEKKLKLYSYTLKWQSCAICVETWQVLELLILFNKVRSCIREHGLRISVRVLLELFLSPEWPAKGEIQMKAVSLKYNINQDAVVRNVSLHIQAGTKVIVMSFVHHKLHLFV